MTSARHREEAKPLWRSMQRRGHGSPRIARSDDAAPFEQAELGHRLTQSRKPAPGRGTILRSIVFFAALFSCAIAECAAAPRGRSHAVHPRSFLFDPFYDDGFYGPVIPELPPPSGYPPIFNFPEENGPPVMESTPRPEGVPYPYPQGFALDVPTLTSDDGAPPVARTGSLDRYRDVAAALARCWSPPPTFAGQRWNTITLRVSFKRDGTVNGIPRIPYADPGLTADARSDLNRSLIAALQRCTPLTFTPGLGQAIAGQIFALRFIEQSPQGAAHVGQPQDPDARDHPRPGGDPPAP